MSGLINRVATLYGNPSPSLAEPAALAISQDRPAFMTPTYRTHITGAHARRLRTYLENVKAISETEQRMETMNIPFHRSY